MVKREFEFKEGTSSKFWSIELTGKSHLVHFGKIGTAGQTSQKEFASNAEAEKSYEKLIAEKTKKGYIEVSDKRVSTTTDLSKSKSTTTKPEKATPKSPRSKQEESSEGSYEITITGPVAIYDEDDEEIQDVALYKKCGALHYTEELCSDYFDPDLQSIGIEGGSIKIEFDPGAGQRLTVVTRYRSPRQLTQEELDRLLRETTGQWSDGMGEGCFDTFQDKNGINIDLRPFNKSDQVKVVQVQELGKPKLSAPPRIFRDVSNGDLAKLAAFLEAGGDVNSKDKKGVPLIIHARMSASENIAIISKLIDAGADVNAFDGYGFSVLSGSVMRGHEKIVAALLKAGADPNLSDRAVKGHHCYGYTPLMWASNRMYKNIIDMLLNAGADINGKGIHGETALAAAAPDDLKIVTYLLERGADPTSCDINNENALDQARFQAETFEDIDKKRAGLWKKKVALLEEFMKNSKVH